MFNLLFQLLVSLFFLALLSIDYHGDLALELRQALKVVGLKEVFLFLELVEIFSVRLLFKFFFKDHPDNFVVLIDEVGHLS